MGALTIEENLNELLEGLKRNNNKTEAATEKIEQMTQSMELLFNKLEESSEALSQIHQEVYYRLSLYHDTKIHFADDEDKVDELNAVIEEFTKLSDFIDYRIAKRLVSK